MTISTISALSFTPMMCAQMLRLQKKQSKWFVTFYKPIEPWDMPGYDAPVIMAAGAFVSGSSIELSADGPIKPPYAVYFQGGLTCLLAIARNINKLHNKIQNGKTGTHLFPLKSA